VQFGRDYYRHHVNGVSTVDADPLLKHCSTPATSTSCQA